jgi:2-succinyl-5-enolpyruvyl-6-hydroxy-3-cyclohexene-1-carboxylate synthase
VLLVGDVSFLHDLGGLALARSLRTSLVIVVLDNDGGRIFDQLPVRQLLARGSEAEQFWRTSPRCDFAAIAQSFRIRFALVESSAELATGMALALGENATTLLQARVAPDSARRVRERVLARLGQFHAALDPGVSA